MDDLICPWCEKHFKRTRTNGRPQKFCSRDCKTRFDNSLENHSDGNPLTSWPRSADVESQVCALRLSGVSAGALAKQFRVSTGTIERVLRRNGLARKRGEGREVQPCGTVAAYQRHKLHGEEPCEACKLALREDRRARYEGKRRPREPQPCGTHTGYVRHRKRGEDPCEACSAAAAEYGRNWREANRARKQDGDRRWKAENYHRVIQANRRRMAWKLAVASEPYTLAVVAARDGYKCGLCRKPVSMKKKWPDRLSPSIDHIVPLALGGDDTRANVQLAHLGCNSRKQARTCGQMALFG